MEEIRPMFLKADHPLIARGNDCYCCKKPFDDKEPICLVPLGPGPFEDARKAAREGRMYNAIAIALHYACVTGIELAPVS